MNSKKMYGIVSIILFLISIVVLSIIDKTKFSYSNYNDCISYKSDMGMSSIHKRTIQKAKILL